LTLAGQSNYNVLKQCVEKGIKSAAIITGGFSESGEEGAKLEEEVATLSKKHNIRILGPNCQGINNVSHNMCASWPLVQERGKTAIISQSGTVGADLEDFLVEQKLGLSCFVNLGNKVDLNEVDFLEFFASDDHVDTIALYLEGTDKGRELTELLRSIDKPVVILKSGRSEKGKKAVKSHTKALAGNDAVWNGVLSQVGAVRAKTVQELYDIVKLFSFGIRLNGDKLAIVSSSGGAGIITADVASFSGLDIIDLTKKMKSKLGNVLPDHCIISNPLDLAGDADANRFMDAMEILTEEGEIDALIAIFGDPIEGAAEVVKKVQDQSDIPIITVYMGGGETEKAERSKFQAQDLTVFQTPEQAIRALKSLSSFPKS